MSQLPQIFGKKDTHVPPEGRDLIRKSLHDAGVTFSFYEPAWAQHAFIRDELSKYAYHKSQTYTLGRHLLTAFQGPLRPCSCGHLLPDAARALRPHPEWRFGTYGWRSAGAGGRVLDVPAHCLPVSNKDCSRSVNV